MSHLLQLAVLIKSFFDLLNCAEISGAISFQLRRVVNAIQSLLVVLRGRPVRALLT